MLDIVLFAIGAVLGFVVSNFIYEHIYELYQLYKIKKDHKRLERKYKNVYN